MSSEEEEILSMFEYTTNNALLHHDQNLMPNEKSLGLPGTLLRTINMIMLLIG